MAKLLSGILGALNTSTPKPAHTDLSRNPRKPPPPYADFIFEKKMVLTIRIVVLNLQQWSAAEADKVPINCRIADYFIPVCCVVYANEIDGRLI